MTRAIAICFDNLSKTYGRGSKAVRAVQNLTLEIEAGQVYGFLGHNGAGKTTTIRLMLDLIHPTQGDVFLFGQHVRRERRVLKRVGSLVEGATFYSFLTGSGNLEVLARTGNVYDPDRIAALLEQVGLSERAGQEVKEYSTGMKQRLGLAAALLNDPDLVILDEPASGLDPSGIQEIRRLIRRLADEQGKTVFFSSHILGEVEQVCDRVAIIRRGELVREGPIAGLLSATSQLRIEAVPLDKAAAVLGEHWEVACSEKWLTVSAAHTDAPLLVRRLVEHDVDVFQVRVERQSLEDFFMSVTG